MVTIEKRKISDYFNPRPPRGGRLARYRQSFHGNTDFNPRPLRGGRHRGGGGGHVSAEISIHAPREGGDLNAPFIPSQTLVFQSTPPARGATVSEKSKIQLQGISIHAPREGGDGKMAVAMGVPTPISIHAPREGGDAGPRQGFPPPCISIHAPREGGD